MKKHLILSALISSMSFAMQTKHNDLIERLRSLTDQLYIFAENDMGQYYSVTQVFEKAAKKIKDHLESHKEEISEDVLQKAFLGAAAVGNEEIIKLFLDAGCDVDTKNEKGQTAAMYAATHSNASTLAALLDADADVNAIKEEELADDLFGLSNIPSKPVCSIFDEKKCLKLIKDKK